MTGGVLYKHHRAVRRDHLHTNSILTGSNRGTVANDYAEKPWQ